MYKEYIFMKKNDMDKRQWRLCIFGLLFAFQFVFTFTINVPRDLIARTMEGKIK